MRMGKKITRRIFRVSSCVIYTIIGKYVCIDYLGTKKSKLSELNLGGTVKYKNIDMDYENVLGIRIPDLLLIFLSCQDSLKDNKSVVILKCPHSMFEYYSNKDSLFLIVTKTITKDFHLR